MQYASLDLIEAVAQKPLASDPKAPAHSRPRSRGPFIANEEVVYTFGAWTVRAMLS
jgi:hypothetical protein